MFFSYLIIFNFAKIFNYITKEIMKKFILFLLPILILFSCKKDKDQGNFTVSGTISDANGKELILNKFTAEKILPLDTIVLNEKGEFNYINSTAAPELFGLQLKGVQGQIMFIADSLDNIKINGSLNDFRDSYTVSGSKHSVLLKEMYDKLNITYAKIDEFRKERQNNSENDSLTKAVDAKYQEVIKENNNYIKDFINTNIESPVAIIALNLAINQQAISLENDRNLFEKISTTLTNIYPKSSLVKNLSDYLKNNPVMVGNPEIGNTATDISQATPEGKIVSLSSLRGNYVLLDFWAAWCRPCRMENPTVLKNYNKYKSKGFTVYQVSLDQKKEDWIKAIEKDGLGEWTHVSDLQYWKSAPAAKYGIRSIPSNFLIDPKGKIIAKDLRGNNLGAELENIYGF